MGKKIGRASIIGEQGIAYIRRAVLDMGHMFYETGGVEAGIDGYIELRDSETGQVGNLILQVQGRATERERLPAETADSFEWPCSEAEINYWRHGTAPVLLIVVQTKTNRAYWKSIRDYFADAHNMPNRRVLFDKHSDVFDSSLGATISTIAASARPGAIALPNRLEERVLPNLVPVSRFGAHLFVASTDCRDNREFGYASRLHAEDAPGEWIVKGGRVLSFHDLDTQPWNQLCDVGTIERFDSREWALASDPDRQRDFVQLLNRALRELTRDDLAYDRNRRILYFRPLDNRPVRTLHYHAFEKNTRRDVVRRYQKKRRPNETAYWRHSGFIGNFRCFGEQWYLEATPTYYFTWNGYREDRFADEHLKRIKELENNSAVIGQFVMWNDYLVSKRATRDMFGTEYPFIGFSRGEGHVVQQGVPDDLWRSKEPRRRATLFDDVGGD